MTEDEMGGITDSMDMSLNKLWELVKTLESPLDCKEIKPINPKGNQP